MILRRIINIYLLAFVLTAAAAVQAFDTARVRFLHPHFTRDISGYPLLADPTFEEHAEVYYPVDGSGDVADGLHPLILFLHGYHAVCYDPMDPVGETTSKWPCPSGFSSIPNFQGYRYLGEALAAKGYIVVSIGANGINANAPDMTLGIPERGELIEYYLALWNMFNTRGGGGHFPDEPFQSRFIGKVDLDNVGTMGHSRGGDGVIQHFMRKGPGSPFSVRAVLTLAPTNYNEFGYISGVPFAALIPYCDGDVYNLYGLKVYDNSRYRFAPEPAEAYTILNMGANHNFFNTIWTPECWDDQNTPNQCWNEYLGFMPAGDVPPRFRATKDDWLFVDPLQQDAQCGTQSSSPSRRLSAREQRHLAETFVVAFFEYYLGRKPVSDGVDLARLLKGDLPYDGKTYIAYHPAADDRVVVNRLNSQRDLSETTLENAGGERGVVTETLTRNGDTYELCVSSRDCYDTGRNGPHASLSRLRIGWSGTGGSYINTLPIGVRDMRAYSALQFRASIDFSGVSATSPMTFSVRLNNGMDTATVSTDEQLGDNVLFVPPGGDLSKTSVMNTVRLPLELFGDDDFLGDVHSIELAFDADTPGTIQLVDIMFAADNCDLDTLPPVFEPVTNQTVSTCSVIDADQVALTVPRADDDCVRLVTVTGVVVKSDNGAEGTPVVSGSAALPIGTHTIRWTADDGANSSSVEQEVTVLPGLFAGRILEIGSDAEVTGVVNGGSGESAIGDDVLTQDIVSAADVFVGERANVDGSIISSGPVTLGATARVTGEVLPYQTLTLPALPSLSEIVFPPPNGAQYDNVNSPDIRTLPPGSYHNLYVNSGATLVMQPGIYYFESLIVHDAASVEVHGGVSVEIYVRDRLEIRSIFTNGLGDAVTPYLGYLGTETVTVEAPWRGTVVAPNADLVLGTGAALTFRGEYMARSLRVRPNVVVVCDAFEHPAPGPSCNDGVRNQNETDVDCGGVCGATCEHGEGCLVHDDCVGHYCSDGLCIDNGTGCREATALDLGGHGDVSTVPTDGCVMVRDAYPTWWGTRDMMLQNLGQGGTPVPFTWTNACSGSSGSDLFTEGWQSKLLVTTDAGCATLINLEGGDNGTISLRYFGG